MIIVVIMIIIKIIVLTRVVDWTNGLRSGKQVTTLQPAHDLCCWWVSVFIQLIRTIQPLFSTSRTLHVWVQFPLSSVALVGAETKLTYGSLAPSQPLSLVVATRLQGLVTLILVLSSSELYLPPFEQRGCSAVAKQTERISRMTGDEAMFHGYLWNTFNRLILCWLLTTNGGIVGMRTDMQVL